MALAPDAHKGIPAGFSRLEIQPGITPLPKVTERFRVFVLSLTTEELELLWCMCFAERAERQPEEPYTGVPVENPPMSYRDTIDREG